MSRADRARLEDLAATRLRDFSDEGYRIGPDDLLEVRIRDLFDTGPAGSILPRSGMGSAAVPDVSAAPAFQQGLRVTAAGEVNIPEVGVILASGCTPRELEQRLSHQLVADGILQRPQVSVSVIEYRSNVVAVVGSVQRPGMYPLTRPGATVADLIWAAGGPTREAGRIVQFAPTTNSQPQAARRRPEMRTRPWAGIPTAPAQLAISQPDAPLADRMGPVVYSDAPQLPVTEPAATTGTPIRIDLETLLQATAQGKPDLNPPVRPGDVINLVPAGNVLVSGWVQKPGPYPITRSLTLTGAVASAGGCSFPADRGHTAVRRILGPGDERVFVVDLDAISDGRERDMPIIDGDVVTLPADNLSLVPWGFWNLVSTLFRFGWTAAVI